MENSISIDKWILFLDGAMMAVFLLVPLFGRKLGTWSDRQAVWWAAVGMAVTAGGRCISDFASRIWLLASFQRSKVDWQR